MSTGKLVAYAVVVYFLYTKGLDAYAGLFPKYDPPFIAPMWPKYVLERNFSLYAFVSRTPDLYSDQLDANHSWPAHFISYNASFTLGSNIHVDVPAQLILDVVSTPSPIPNASSRSRVQRSPALWLHVLLTFRGVPLRTALAAAAATATRASCGHEHREAARRRPPPHLATLYSTAIVAPVQPERTAASARIVGAARDARLVPFTVPLLPDLVASTNPHTEPCPPGAVPPEPPAYAAAAKWQQTHAVAAAARRARGGLRLATVAATDSAGGTPAGAATVRPWVRHGAPSPPPGTIAPPATPPRTRDVWAVRASQLLSVAASDVRYGVEGAPAAVVAAVSGRVVGGPQTKYDVDATVRGVEAAFAAAQPPAAAAAGGDHAHTPAHTHAHGNGVEGGYVGGAYDTYVADDPARDAGSALPPHGVALAADVAALRQAIADALPPPAVEPYVGLYPPIGGLVPAAVMATAVHPVGVSVDDDAAVRLWAMGAAGGGCGGAARLPTPLAEASAAPAAADAGVSRVDALIGTEVALAAADAADARVGCSAVRIHVRTELVPEAAWRAQHFIARGLRSTEAMLGNVSNAVAEVDALRGLIFDTHPVILFAIFAISIAHLVLDSFAIYSDVSFYSASPDALVGLSVQNAAFEVICEAVAGMFLLRSGAGVLICLPAIAVAMVSLYKWIRLLRLEIVWFVPIRILCGAPIGVSVRKVPALTDPNAVHRAALTAEVDRITTRALLFGVVPAAVLWGTYAWLRHQPLGAGGLASAAAAAAEAVSSAFSPAPLVVATTAAAASSLSQSGSPAMSLLETLNLYASGAGGLVLRLWWTPFTLWLLETAAMFVYGLQFVLMFPQVVLNHKLRTVQHMPWHGLVARAIRTFIDDVFAAFMPMPTLHFLAVFRDDVVFIIFLVQYWLYPRKSAAARVADASSATTEDKKGGDTAQAAAPVVVVPEPSGAAVKGLTTAKKRR